MADHVAVEAGAGARRLFRFAVSPLAISTGTAALVGATVLSPSLAAPFGPIDDHEPLRWIGRSGRLALADVPATFYHETEVGDWGTTRRWRPAYYAARVTEAALFGDRPALWYAAVAVAFVATCTLLGWASTRVFVAVVSPPTFVSPIFAGFSTLCFAGLPAWRGIVGRLGPSEQLAFLATAIAIAALAQLTNTRHDIRWLAVAATAAGVAVMSKESFGLVPLLPFAVGGVLFAERRHRAVGYVAALSLTPSLLVAAILAPSVLVGGSDVYGRSTGGSRWSGAVDALTRGELRVSVLTSMLAIATVVGARLLNLTPVQRRLLFAVAGWSSVSVLVDAWLYAGAYWAPRYLAVPNLMAAVQTIGSLCVIARLAHERVELGKAWVALGGACAIASCLVALPAVVNTAEAVRVNRTAARAYTRGVETFSSLDGPAAIVVSRTSDYESALATTLRAWRSAEREREVFLVVNTGPIVGAIDTLQEELIRISHDGSDDYRISPLSEMPETVACGFLNNEPYAIAPCEAAFTIVAVGM